MGTLTLLTACSFNQESNGSIDNNTSSSVSSVSSVSSSSVSSAQYPPLSDSEKEEAEAYLENNIDALVTVTPSVLGGTYQTTEIEWYTDNTAIVLYEDGHIQGRARATITVDGDTVTVVQFTELTTQE